MLITNNIRFLGFQLQSNLKWNLHIGLITKQISSRLHIIRSLKNSLTNNQLIFIYNGLIQPIIDYCLPIQFNLTKKDVNRLLTLQNRAHRIICNLSCLANFYDRRDRLSSNLLAKISLNSDHIIYNILPHKSERSSRFILPNIQSNNFLNSFIIQSCINHNNSI